ncbi:hypothetical protein RB195_022295 [Necator americanus]|uniref:Reverse transcriptase domain-containing protein n=1 Tax=Necator americanus TaxID=51031 RepID=A0ABR1EEZ9_NECAM
MQSTFAEFEAAFDSLHRGRLLNALCADGVPEKFVRLLDDMDQLDQQITAVRTPTGCTTPFEWCTLKNNGSYEKDIQQRYATAIFAFNSLTKCLWSTSIANELKLRIYLSAIRSIMMYGSETW